ncbi:MAG: DNA polymerase III subunit gamma/tau [Planctomycetota bacterium]|nr:DNA polymerase III subunit gamma/tau [Planctomycetota bacterium]
MAYTVLARRYRSMTFDEVIGQEPIAKALKNAISQNRVAHAYLFAGTRGVGKTTMARILARALNCEKGPTPEPCGKCDICQAIHRGDDMDVLEIDGASNNLVEDIRVIRENAHYRPARAHFKIYYIDEVHMLSKSAFNALLKTLEEPPEHVKFIFATTEPERLPATVLSRCQRFDFRAVPTERIAGHLKDILKREKIKAEPEAVLAVARAGRGSVRDAMTLLDQVIAVGDGQVTLEAVRQTVGAASGEKVLAVLSACAAGETGKALAALAELLAGGVDFLVILEQLIRQVRDLLVVKTCGQEAELLDVFGPDRKALAATAEKLSVPALVAWMGYLGEARTRARWVVDPRPIAELALVRMAAASEMETLPQVLAKLETVQRSLRGAAPPAGPDRKAGVSLAPVRPAPPPAADEKKKTVGPAAAVEAARLQEQPRPDAADDPLVQKTVRLFNGRIIRKGE